MAAFAQINVFNAQLQSIVDMLAAKFPEDKDIALTKSQVELARQTNSRLPAMHFTKEVSRHLDELYKRDEHFFLSLVKTEYNDALSSLDIPHKWACLNEGEKDYLWKTTQTLARLGVKITHDFMNTVTSQK